MKPLSKPAGAGIILLNKRNEILLILRDDNPAIRYPNQWDLPGGHVEPGENPEETIRREMKEELELDLGAITLFSEYHHDDFDEYVFIKRIELDPSTLPLHEGQKCEYFDEPRIRSTPLAYSYNKVLADFFSRIDSTKTLR